MGATYSCCGNLSFEEHLLDKNAKTSALLKQKHHASLTAGVCNDLLNCKHLEILKNALNAYHETSALSGDVSIQDIVDSFTEIVTKFCDDDMNFKYIHNQLKTNDEDCDIRSCKLRTRRQKDEILSNIHIKDVVLSIIMKKVLFYFAHSYDIGTRLTQTESAHIYDHETDNKEEQNQTSAAKIQKLHNLIHHHKISLIQQQQNASRYNHHPSSFKYLSESKTYSFGSPFKYSYSDAEQKMYEKRLHFQYGKGILVRPKYRNIKEELTSNIMYTMSIQRFDAEMVKTQIHFDSVFCKMKYKPYIDPTSREVIGDIQIEYLFAMSVYCNFDGLQYEFSKTYRESTEKHSQFYHMGKFLKLLVNLFGWLYHVHNLPSRYDSRKDEFITQTLYHGIAEKLAFTAHGIGERGIQIFAPFSATSSLAVAIHFTQQNLGLIIEVGTVLETGRSLCFPCAWLSDYTYEKEHFFLQMISGSSLTITNIIEPSTGYEYRVIFDALGDIDYVVTRETLVVHGRGIKCPKLWIAIINYRLMLNLEEFQLTEYAVDICNTYFYSKQLVSLHVSKIQELAENVFKMLFPPNKCIVNLQMIHILFPNATEIRIDAYDWDTPLEELVSMARTIETFTAYFEAKGYRIYSVKDSRIRIAQMEDKKQQIEFIIDALDAFFGCYDIDAKDEDITFISKVMDNIFSRPSIIGNNEQVVIERCKEKRFLECLWSNAQRGRMQCLYDTFYCNDTPWIYFDKITAIYENLECIEIKNIILDKTLIETVLKKIQGDKVIACWIKLYPLKNSPLDIQTVVSDFQNELVDIKLDEDIFSEELYLSISKLHEPRS